MPTCSLGESLSFVFSARVELLRNWVCGEPPPPGEKFASAGKLRGPRRSLRCAVQHVTKHSRREAFRREAFPGRSVRGTKHPRPSNICVTNEFARPPLLLDVVWLAGSDISQQAADLPSQS